MTIYDDHLSMAAGPQHIADRFKAQGFPDQRVEIVACIEIRTSGVGNVYGLRRWGVAVGGELRYVAKIINRKGFPVMFYGSDSLLFRECLREEAMAGSGDPRRAREH